MEKKKKENKRKNKVIEVLMDNLVSIITFLIGLGLGVTIMLNAWPDRIATLRDGSQNVAEIKGKTYTADDYYKILKNNDSTNLLIDSIDYYILKDKYDLEEEATKYANEQSKTIYESYKNYYGYTKEQFLSGNGFDSEEEFLDYLKKEHYYKHHYDLYTKNTIKEEDLNKYYKDKVFGDKKVYIFSSTEDNKDLENIVKDLKKNPDFKAISSKYSKVSSNEITVTYKDSETYSALVVDTVRKTKKGKVSEVITDSKYGKFVIYVLEEGKKQSFKATKNDLMDILVSEKQSNDEKLYYKAFIELRNEYNLKFNDTKLEKSYKQSIVDYE